PAHPGTGCTSCRSLRSTGSSWGKSTVKEGVMDGFAVLQKDNPKIAIFHLWDLCPASKPAVGLLHLAYGGFGCPPHPLVRDHRAVGARLHGVEIGSGLHAENLTDCE